MRVVYAVVCTQLWIRAVAKHPVLRLATAPGGKPHLKETSDIVLLKVLLRLPPWIPRRHPVLPLIFSRPGRNGPGLAEFVVVGSHTLNFRC